MLLCVYLACASVYMCEFRPYFHVCVLAVPMACALRCDDGWLQAVSLQRRGAAGRRGLSEITPREESLITLEWLPWRGLQIFIREKYPPPRKCFQTTKDEMQLKPGVESNLCAILLLIHCWQVPTERDTLRRKSIFAIEFSSISVTEV